ncbi:MAG: hypothetical protein AAGU12_13930 [Clostridiales bacterium]
MTEAGQEATEKVGCKSGEMLKNRSCVAADSKFRLKAEANCTKIEVVLHDFLQIGSDYEKLPYNPSHNLDFCASGSEKQLKSPACHHTTSVFEQLATVNPILATIRTAIFQRPPLNPQFCSFF